MIPNKHFSLAVCLAVCLTLCSMWGVATAQDTSALLPNGARALNEDYGQWQVNCAVVGNGGAARRTCVIGQRQTNGQGQQVLAIELWPSKGDMSGLVVMPFGIAVREPVSISIDSGTTPLRANLSTCLQTGCIVPLTIGGKMVTEMRTGNKLVISARSHDGKDYTFSISLDGFAAAATRLQNLSGG